MGAGPRPLTSAQVHNPSGFVSGDAPRQRLATPRMEAVIRWFNEFAGPEGGVITDAIVGAVSAGDGITDIEVDGGYQRPDEALAEDDADSEVSGGTAEDEAVGAE